MGLPFKKYTFFEITRVQYTRMDMMNFFVRYSQKIVNEDYDNDYDRNWSFWSNWMKLWLLTGSEKQHYNVIVPCRNDDFLDFPQKR